MGTRGAFGVRIDGVDKVVYNHWDSYPSGLGAEILREVRCGLIDEGKARALCPTETEYPTEADFERLIRFYDGNVNASHGRLTWYQLLRHTQGSLEKVLEAGVFEDSIGFLRDSLFCEWAYIVNLDSKKFEVYRGYQKAPHKNGRFAQCEPLRDGYYPVALVAEFKFDDIPNDWAERMESEDE